MKKTFCNTGINIKIYSFFWLQLQYRWLTPGPQFNSAFQNHLPNSARIGYATEEAFYISAQLSANVVSAL